MNKHYVYQHVDPTTGEIVYIGMGTGGRAWGILNKNKKHHLEHRLFLDNLLELGYLPNDWVKIIERNLTKENAFLKELKLIHELGIPKFNFSNGEKQWSSKLNDSQVLDIMGLLKTDIKHKKIAEQFNVSKATIDKISQRKTHRGITVNG